MRTIRASASMPMYRKLWLLLFRNTLKLSAAAPQ